MSIDGLMVRMSRPVDNKRPCCDSVCVIHAGKGPHVGELRCAGCGRHRGWLSKATAIWLADAVHKHGAPTSPINVPWIEIAILEWRRRFQMLTGATKNEANNENA
jgi:hypothetical protein